MQTKILRRKKMRRVRRWISALLVLALTLTMMPTGFKSAEVEVNAAVAGITNGGTYKIVSAYNGKTIIDKDLYENYTDCVVWNANAMSDLAKWTVKESGDYYTFVNIVSKKGIKVDGDSKNGGNVDLNNGNDNSDRYKWKLVPITSGKYAGCFYIVSAMKNEEGQEEYAEIISDDDKRDQDGATIRLWTKAKSPEEGEPRQIWKLEKTTAEDTVFTEAMADQALEAFKNKYFVYDSNTGFNSLGGGFWGIAEVMEAMLDGYETTGKKVYKEMFEGTYNAFIKRNGEHWSNNDFNDDIAWAVLASARAYLMFGDQKYKDIAKWNYDFMYDRAILDNGMLRWSHENGRGTGSLSCINGPGTVAACYMAQVTGDDSYYTKAKNIFNAWRNSKMYVREGDDAGHVWDGEGSSWRSTYNQGTFIGAATMLYERYGDEQYRIDAYNAMKNSMNLCYKVDGMYILHEERADSGDLSGMRGILMRYMRKFIRTFDAKEYSSFFLDNARIAWMNRNSQNIIRCAWHEKTPEDYSGDSFAAYNAISLMANIPTYSDTLERDAYSTIEAEDMDYTKGLISENSSGTSGGRSLGGVKDGHYTAYYNVDFGSTGASKLKLRYSRETEESGVSGTAEFRLGSTTGPLIAMATLENTGSWSDWREITVDTARVTGVQNVYVVFKATTNHVCNFDYFTFEKATTENQGYMVLKSESAGKYAQCKSGNNDTTLVAKSDNKDDWEELRVEKNNDGTVSFKSLISGKYVRAVAGSNGYYVTANGTSINNETKFILERYSNNTSKNQQLAIKSVLTGKYLTVNPDDGDKNILANSESVGGAWETFWFETVNGQAIVPDGSVLIASAYKDAYTQIAALNYDSQNGIADDPSNIGGTHNGDWVAYDEVQFGDVSPATVKISYSRNQSSCSGDGYVDVILDDINNAAIATVKLQSTAPNSWSNYINMEAEVTKKVTGTHTVYLKFRGGSGNIANVAWFTFNKQSGIRDAFSVIEAESHDAFDGTIDYTDPIGYVGNTNENEWVRYDSVRFDKTAKAIKFRYACNSKNATGKIFIYLDGMDYDPVGEVRFEPTGDTWDNYVELSENLSKEIAEGIHSVYFKFIPDDGKTYVGNFDWFQFLNDDAVVVKPGSVKVEGYQISTSLGGNRVIGSVEPEIDGKKVTKWGFIYGLSKANGKDYGITDDDMYVGAENQYVKSYESTPIGTASVKLGDSSTATYFIRTMLFSAFTSNAFSAEYKVRAYALLENGKYVYSDVKGYSIFSIASYLYENKLMNTLETHEYLYNKILTTVDKNYTEVDYAWGNTVVRPGTLDD